MGTVEEKWPISDITRLPKEKEKASSTAPEVSLPAQKILLPGLGKEPSHAQATINKWDAIKKVAHEELRPDKAIQQVEATLLANVLCKGLFSFEQGQSYPTTSESGEVVLIPPGDKQRFVQAFFEDLVSLFFKSEGRRDLRKHFYSLLSRFAQSTSFQSICPQWSKILEERLLYTEGLSRDILQQEQSIAEKEFCLYPSVNQLAHLISLDKRISGELVGGTTIQPTRTLESPKVVEGRIARIVQLFLNFLSHCARRIADVSVTIFSGYLKVLCPPFKRTETLLRMAHARFHRTVVDGAAHKDSIPILDGGTPWTSFDHFMKNDWEPTRALLKNWTTLSETSQNTLQLVEEALSRSQIFFRTAFDRFVPQTIKAHVAIQKIHLQKEGDILVIPAGMSGHSVLYEVQKTKTGIHLKIYDAGGATDARTGRFTVPVFEIETKDIKRVLEEMFALDALSEKRIFKKYSLAHTEHSLIAAAIRKIVGFEPFLAETHREQDRGNCFWKAFSTWINSQLKECSVRVSPEMVATSREKTPYATEDLKILADAKEALPLSRFMHRIAYEKVREQLSEIFTTRKPDLTLHLKKDKLMFFSFTAYYAIDSEATDKKAADKYISSLVRGIIAEPAAKRYRRKGLKRRLEKLPSFPTEQ